MKHDENCLAVFGEKAIDEGLFMGHFYGTFFGKSGRSHVITNYYGKGLLYVFKAKILKYGATSLAKFTASNWRKKDEWVAAAPCWIKWYINHLHYLPGDKTSPNDKLNHPRTANSALVQNRKVKTDTAKTSYNTLEINSFCPIPIGKCFQWLGSWLCE